MLGGNETVLVAEDQAEVRQYAVAVLKENACRVIPAEDVLLCQREPIELVLTDVVMPHVNGREPANQLAKLQPGIKMLFMSGYTGNVIAHHGVCGAARTAGAATLASGGADCDPGEGQGNDESAHILRYPEALNPAEV